MSDFDRTNYVDMLPHITHLSHSLWTRLLYKIGKKNASKVPSNLLKSDCEFEGLGKFKIKERGGGQNFSTSFWMRFRQAPLCRYRFKVIFDDIIFLLSGNIIEYICFWRFNSIIMTWNKSLIFTKSVIMGLNNISPWPCPLCIVRLPCVITWLYSTPLLSMRAVGVVVCLSLRKANFPGSRRTQFSVVSVIFYCYHCFVLFALFFTQWLIYPFSFHIDCLI